jgi:hypothetical protein
MGPLVVVQRAGAAIDDNVSLRAKSRQVVPLQPGRNVAFMHTAFAVAKIEVGHTARAVCKVSSIKHLFQVYTYQLYSNIVNLPFAGRNVAVMHNTTTAFFW